MWLSKLAGRQKLAVACNLLQATVDILLEHHRLADTAATSGDGTLISKFGKFGEKPAFSRKSLLSTEGKYYVQLQYKEQ